MKLKKNLVFSIDLQVCHVIICVWIYYSVSLRWNQFLCHRRLMVVLIQLQKFLSGDRVKFDFRILHGDPSIKRKGKTLVVVVLMRRSCETYATVFLGTIRCMWIEKVIKFLLPYCSLLVVEENKILSYLLCATKKITRRFQVHCSIYTSYSFMLGLHLNFYKL